VCGNDDDAEELVDNQLNDSDSVASQVESILVRAAEQAVEDGKDLSAFRVGVNTGKRTSQLRTRGRGSNRRREIDIGRDKAVLLFADRSIGEESARPDELLEHELFHWVADYRGGLSE